MRGKTSAGQMKSLTEVWLCLEKSGKNFTSKKHKLGDLGAIMPASRQIGRNSGIVVVLFAHAIVNYFLLILLVRFIASPIS